MRLLHVADWHLGATLGRVSRLPDHMRVLDEMNEIAASFQPHLIVHAGDLFDGTRPPFDALQLAADALGRLAAIAPTVVVAGNHDSRALFRALDTFQAAHPQRRLWFVTEPTVLSFAGDDNEELRLGCMPFAHPNALVDVLGVDGSWTGTYADQIGILNARLAENLSRDYDPERHILLYAAHLHVHEALLAGTERAVHVSDDYATHAQSIPKVTYAAFGHIHRPQPLPGGTVTGRYAGSPLPIDFGEHGQEKAVFTIEARPGDAARVTTRALSGGRRLVRFEGTWPDFVDQADLVDDGILKAIVDTDAPDPELADKVIALCPNAAIFEITNRWPHNGDRAISDLDAGASEPNIHELFREYMTAQKLRRATMDSVAALFTAAIAGVEAEQPASFGLGDLLRDPTEGFAAAPAQPGSGEAGATQPILPLNGAAE